MINGSVVLLADIWQGGEIVADIWNEDGTQYNIGSEAFRTANYYLKQMNFLGNEITGA